VLLTVSAQFVDKRRWSSYRQLRGITMKDYSMNPGGARGESSEITRRMVLKSAGLLIGTSALATTTSSLRSPLSPSPALGSGPKT
jgi:hypothetical protein